MAPREARKTIPLPPLATVIVIVILIITTVITIVFIIISSSSMFIIIMIISIIVIVAIIIIICIISCIIIIPAAAAGDRGDYSQLRAISKTDNRKEINTKKLITTSNDNTTEQQIRLQSAQGRKHNMR